MFSLIAPSASSLFCSKLSLSAPMESRRADSAIVGGGNAYRAWNGVICSDV